MNRTVKDATTKAFHDSTTKALCAHVLAVVSAYNFAKHLNSGDEHRSKPSVMLGTPTQTRSRSSRATSPRNQTPSHQWPADDPERIKSGDAGCDLVVVLQDLIGRYDTNQPA